MIIGMPKEIKNGEYRVAMIPSSVTAFIRSGHHVYVEKDAGARAGFSDREYEAAGAITCDSKTVYDKSDMIYKVKEVLPAEYNCYKEGQILFTYIHSASRPVMTKVLLESKIIGIAYEDVDDEEGRLPLLAPMSEIAGKGAFIAAFKYQQTLNGGKGRLLSRVCGLEVPRIMIIVCGHTGMAAAEYAAAFGNHVTMLDVNRKAMENAHKLSDNIEILYSNRENILSSLKQADVIINCIMWDQRYEGHIVYKEDLKLMKQDAIIIDVSSDEAGAIETCVITSQDNPVYKVDGILHYCVPNIPSLYANSASILLSARTLPYALKIANNGAEKALKEDKHLRRGLSFYCGLLTNKENAEANNLSYTSADELINSF